MAERSITRRQALRDLGVAGIGATALGSVQGLLDAAAAATPKTGTLKDIEHVVILIQENRSFDHYFGTLSGVRGFADKPAHQTFFQPDLSGHKLHPFHLAEGCLPDISHDWGPQHQSWNAGRMDGFVTSRAPASVDGPTVAPETMGYYRRSDIPVYYALADAFTICDGYHCSVIGPTDPNRLMSMTATIDPAGTHGGPMIQTNVANRTGRLTWTTMPEQLQAKGISWKVYTAGAGGVFDNVLTYFKQYSAGSPLEARGLKPVYPDDFIADLDNNRLPQVSWVLTRLSETEHPDFSAAVAGDAAAREIFEALATHPKIWPKTALFITWDENGGFFDHVPPQVAPLGTQGEYLTVAPLPDDPSFHGVAEGISGPIGLGFRVPALVVSPFSRGGLVCSDTFDHTSMLRFLETRFGARVPNLSSWRRRVTGDMTSAFNFAAIPGPSRPSLPRPSTANASCAAPANTTPVGYVSQSFPKQERGTRRRPSGIGRHH